MNIFRFIGVFTIIPATLLLTVSFFVLFALRKLESQGLKAFGYVIAAMLWVSALLVFSCGVYTISTGRHPVVDMMQGMMSGHMQQMMGHQRSGMMGAPMPSAMPASKCAGMKGQMPGAMPSQSDKTVK
jgi:hypothetical protein